MCGRADKQPLTGKKTMFSNSLILVAGGDAADRETILQALNDEFHVVAAQTIEDALAHAEDSVGLVICDLDSTQIHGMELIREWKARQPQTPFVALSNGHDVGSAVEAMKNGVADCLVKPIDQDDLRATAMQLVGAQSHSTSLGNGEDSPKSSRKLHIDIPPGTSLEDLERAAVEQALVQHHGNRTHAAKTLGISVRTLQRKLKAWGMPIASFPNSGPGNGFVMPAHAGDHHVFSTHVH
jgi:DNA-binding NtrC family response regulator